MKQTLLKFALDNWFEIETRAGILHLGIGFLLIPWILLGLFEVISLKRSGSNFREQRGSLIVWSTVALLICGMPLFAAELPIDAVPVFGWGFMLVLGFVAAGLFSLRRGKQIGISSDMIWDLGIQVMLSGIIGARLFYLIQYHERTFKNVRGIGEFVQKALYFMDGGMVLFGGMLMSSFVGVLYCRRHKIPVLLLCDAIMPAVFLGLAFGRLGCLMNGCCFGDACSLPWGIQFPENSPPWFASVEAGWIDRTDPLTIPLHPTQIYSALNAFILAGLTAVWFRHRRYDGDTVVLALLTYPVARITIEFLRSDESGQFGTMFTISQWLSFGLLLCGMALLLLKPKRLTPLPLHLPEKPSETERSASRK